MTDPVCPLVLALYGHPDSGGYWEKHCDRHLSKVGFNKVPGWDSCYVQPNLKLFLIVYVDDFKLSGPKASVEEGWKLISSGIEMDPPTASGKYLGCGHIRMDPARPLEEQFESEIGKSHGGCALVYDMESFMDAAVVTFCELTGKTRSELKRAPTPGPNKVLEDGTGEDCQEAHPGKMTKIASRVLMKLLYGARMARFDLLRTIGSLASRIHTWSEGRDRRLIRLVEYVNDTLKVHLTGWV